jgi:hypothetical protein
MPQPLEELERSLIDEYVRDSGYDPRTLSNLAERVRQRLLRAASVYASSKLTEVEARSRFVERIHEKP